MAWPKEIIQYRDNTELFADGLVKRDYTIIEDNTELFVVLKINWPPGSGSGCLLFIKDLKKFLEKVQYFVVFNDFLPS
jgi:hypothetical protein